MLSNHPTLEAILKYKNHHSVETISCFTKHLSSFYFSQVGQKKFMKETKNLEINMAIQDKDIPVKILKENGHLDGLRQKVLCVYLQPTSLLKKRLQHRCFPVSFAKILRTPFFKERLWWLLLSLWYYYHRQNTFSDLNKL